MPNRPAETWSDEKKFWAETCRTVIFGALGAAIATMILGAFSDAHRSEREIRAKAIDEFIHASHHYTFVLYGLCDRGAFDWSIYEEYRASRRALFIYFDSSPDVVSALKKTEQLDDKLRQACDARPRLGQKTWEPMREGLDAADDNAALLAADRLSRWWKLF